jgi:hypothetical protein
MSKPTCGCASQPGRAQPQRKLSISLPHKNDTWFHFFLVLDKLIGPSNVARLPSKPIKNMLSTADRLKLARAILLARSVQAPGIPAVEPPASVTELVTERRKFPRSLPLVELNEGNGGDTEWDLWVQAVATSDLENSFPPTEQSPLAPI